MSTLWYLVAIAFMLLVLARSLVIRSHEAIQVNCRALVVAESKAALKADATKDANVVAEIPRGGLVVIKRVGKGKFLVQWREMDGWVAMRNLSPPDKAIDIFGRAIATKPTAADCRGRGNAWTCKHEYDRAIADYTDAIHLDPKDATSYFDRGISYGRKGDHEKAIADFSQAIQLDPSYSDVYAARACVSACKNDYPSAFADCAEAFRLGPKRAALYITRAWLYWRTGELDNAISDFDMAVGLSPDVACHYERRGILLIQRQDYDRGLQDLQTAIRLGTNDPAAQFEAWAKSTPTAAALEHGKRQVAQMLKDRPNMGQFGEQTQVLYDWAARKFAGEDLGMEIRWDGSNPAADTLASHQSPVEGRQGSIRLWRTHNDGPEEGKDLSFEETWQCAVFELYNIANTKAFKVLDIRARSGRISKGQFVAGMVEIESRAAEKTRSFYIHVFLPLAKTHHAVTHPEHWYLGVRATADENLLLGWVDRNGSYWRYYEAWYDYVALFRLLKRGKTEAVRQLAAKLLADARTDIEKARIHAALGWYCVQRGNYDQAIVDCSEAIRLDPGRLDAYANRTIAYSSKSEYDKAAADYQELLRLNPQDANARCGLGYIWVSTADYEKAIAEYTKAIDMDPKCAGAYYGRGYARSKAGDKAKARQDFQKAKRLGYKPR